MTHISELDGFDEVVAEEVGKNFPELRYAQCAADLDYQVDKTTRYILQELNERGDENYSFVRACVVNEFSYQLDEVLCDGFDMEA